MTNWYGSFNNYFFKTVIVVGCMVVDHRIRILSPGVPASFEAMEEDGEERGGGERGRGEGEGRGGGERGRGERGRE